METIIKTENLKFLDIINYPDIAIQKNQTTFITGESGSGKSTLFHLINATIAPSEGKVLYQGVDNLTIDTIHLRKEVLLASQALYLFDGTIEDNFKIFYDFREQPLISQTEMKKYLDICQLNFPVDANCTTMSGGEQQRVFIAICLSFRPKVFLLDEPTSALDAETAEILLNNLKNHSQENGMTLLIISHDQGLVHRFADEVITLEGK